MFLRLLHLTIRPESAHLIMDFYKARVISRLSKIPGCLHASLIRDSENTDQVISMTMWDSQAHAEKYEKSGVFKELMGEAEPFLADATEWKLQLTEDMSLDYVPADDHQTPRVFSVSSMMGQERGGQYEFGQMYVRIVTLKVESGKMGELQSIYNEEIIPELKKVPGCRYAYLSGSTKNDSEALSVTIWESKIHAENYVKSGKYAELLGRLEPVFSRLYQWKMTLEKDKKGSLTTNTDAQVSKYGVVTGRKFK